MAKDVRTGRPTDTLGQHMIAMQCIERKQHD